MLLLLNDIVGSAFPSTRMVETCEQIVSYLFHNHDESKPVSHKDLKNLIELSRFLLRLSEPNMKQLKTDKSFLLFYFILATPTYNLTHS